MNSTMIIDLMNSSESFNLSINHFDDQPLEALGNVSQVILMTLYSTTSIVSILTNSLVLFVLIFGRKSSPELKLFLINLAISDICMAALSIPFTYTDFMLGRWIFPKLLCESPIRALYLPYCTDMNKGVRQKLPLSSKRLANSPIH